MPSALVVFKLIASYKAESIAGWLLVDGGGVRKLFHIGPVLMLVPLVVWAVGWNVALRRTSDNDDWYIMWPMWAFLALTVLWHAALVAAEKERRSRYLIYAIVFLPTFFLLWLLAAFVATRITL